MVELRTKLFTRIFFHKFGELMRYPTRILKLARQKGVLKMITINQTQTREELNKYAQICHQLTTAMIDGLILRFILANGNVFEGYLHRMHMDSSGAMHGNYWGYVEILTEDNKPQIIDLLSVNYIKCITTREILQKYADKGVISIAGDFND